MLYDDYLHEMFHLFPWWNSIVFLSEKSCDINAGLRRDWLEIFFYSVACRKYYWLYAVSKWIWELHCFFWPLWISFLFHQLLNPNAWPTVDVCWNLSEHGHILWPRSSSWISLLGRKANFSGSLECVQFSGFCGVSVTVRCLGEWKGVLESYGPCSLVYLWTSNSIILCNYFIGVILYSWSSFL